jgi:hypothetical protein
VKANGSAMLMLLRNYGREQGAFDKYSTDTVEASLEFFPSA